MSFWFFLHIMGLKEARNEGAEKVMTLIHFFVQVLGAEKTDMIR